MAKALGAGFGEFNTYKLGDTEKLNEELYCKLVGVSENGASVEVVTPGVARTYHISKPIKVVTSRNQHLKISIDDITEDTARIKFG